MSLNTDESQWAKELRRSPQTPQSFFDRSWISKEILEKSETLRDQLEFRTSPAVAKEISQNKATIKKQFIPSLDELEHHPLEQEDPIGDNSFEPVPGLTHRYKDRVLLKPTHHCAVYCRFCFRREKVSHSGYQLSKEQFESALEYIRSHPEINEVILTGGDPLTLTNSKLESLIEAISSIDHVRFLRIHTRVPSVLPSRVTKGLLDVLTSSKKPIWIAVHINTHDEVSEPQKAAIRSLTDRGIPLLHQGVLLKGINDSTESLKELLLKMAELKIKPYYLHYPDLAKGTNHFRVPLEKGIKLIRSLRGQLPGFAIPQLVVDIPGGGGKVIVVPEMARKLEENKWEFVSPITGEVHKVTFPPENSHQVSK